MPCDMIQMAVLGKNEGEHSASKLMRNTEDLIASRRDCSQALNHVNAAKFFMKGRRVRVALNL